MQRTRAEYRVRGCRVGTGCFPLLFAALTGRSGHGLARMRPDSLAYPLGH